MEEAAAVAEEAVIQAAAVVETAEAEVDLAVAEAIVAAAVFPTREVAVVAERERRPAEDRINLRQVGNAPLRGHIRSLVPLP
jgi:hypothetical protein